VLDGIVFDTPSAQKVVVAVVDPQRGPVFRTVHPRTLSERDEAGVHDLALRGLIRRTPSTARGGPSGAKGSVQGRRGHSRSAMHRTTGK
jgi:hypothetical protein